MVILYISLFGDYFIGIYGVDIGLNENPPTFSLYKVIHE
jgi:hypothetical protein